MPAQAVLLWPSDVPDAGLEGPSYGEVRGRSRGQDTVVHLLVGPDGSPSRTVRVDRAIVAEREVVATEPSPDAPGWLLCRGVYFASGATFVHGQVIAYGSEEFTLRTRNGVVQVPHDAVTEVAPVIAVLLWSATLLSSIDSGEKLQSAHTHLGQNGSRASRNIAQLLSGIVEHGTSPVPSAKVPWMCPHTGVEKALSVGHVVNYAYYRDGGRPTPRSIQLGDWYCDVPAVPARSAPTQSRRSTLGHSERADDAEDDEETSIREDQRFGDLLASLEQPSPAKRQRVSFPSVAAVEQVEGEQSTVPSAHDSTTLAILKALAPYPHLLAGYAHQLNQLDTSRGQSNSPPVNHQPPVSFLHPSVSDLLPVEGGSDRQQVFRPSRLSQDVHRVISAPEYSGKLPDSFLDHVRNSPSSKFFPHPGIISRLFDFQFGAGNLSILHFSRFDLTAQLEQPGQKSVSLINYALALPEVDKSPSFEALVESLEVLLHYVIEFCESTTRRLVSTAKEFCAELKDYGPWVSAEVKGLALWFTRVFASYRMAIINDLSTGSSTSQLVRTRVSMQDAELGALLLKLSRTYHQARSGGGRGSDGNGHQNPGVPPTRTSTTPPVRRAVRIPPDVFKHVPRQNGRQLCLRYISRQGCPSRSPDSCVNGYLAHFEPEHLHPAVRDFVSSQYGGVRAGITDF